MKKTRIMGVTLALLLAVSLTSAANAQQSLFNNKQANLQAMRWFAENQMSRGLPNPFPGVNLYTGQGFRDFSRGLTNPYLNNFGYGNPYGYQYSSPYFNPYSNNHYGNTIYANPLYGNGGGYWY